MHLPGKMFHDFLSRHATILATTRQFNAVALQSLAFLVWTFDSTTAREADPSSWRVAGRGSGRSRGTAGIARDAGASLSVAEIGGHGNLPSSQHFFMKARTATKSGLRRLHISQYILFCALSGVILREWDHGDMVLSGTSNNPCRPTIETGSINGLKFRSQPYPPSQCVISQLCLHL